MKPYLWSATDTQVFKEFFTGLGMKGTLQNCRNRMPCYKKQTNKTTYLNAWCWFNTSTPTYTFTPATSRQLHSIYFVTIYPIYIKYSCKIFSNRYLEEITHTLIVFIVSVVRFINILQGEVGKNQKKISYLKRENENTNE